MAALMLLSLSVVGCGDNGYVQADGPPPLGLHLLLGDTRAEKMQNVVANIRAGCLAPVEIIAERS